jgi:hypothetical protein
VIEVASSFVAALSCAEVVPQSRPHKCKLSRSLIVTPDCPCNYGCQLGGKFVISYAKQRRFATANAQLHTSAIFVSRQPNQHPDSLRADGPSKATSTFYQWRTSASRSMTTSVTSGG